MITKEDLAQFTGTERYYRWWIPNFVLTDGAHYLAANGASWLIDAIVSHIKSYRDQYMAIFTLKVKSSTATLSCTGDEDTTLFTQKIGYTDFPLDEIKLFVSLGDETTRVVALMSEY
jgi:hypothetical protein